jgi:serine protease Do
MEERIMKSKLMISLGAVMLMAVILVAQPAAGAQNPPDISTVVAAQASAQAQAEVQAALAQAQAEVARAMDEVKHNVSAKVQKEIAAKLAAHRGAMLADLHARQAELAALVQEKVTREKVTREAGPLLALQDSESGWLGVQIADVDADKVKELKLPAERGVLITEVEADSPAAKAGLKANDVVTEYNGQRIESATQFRRMVRESLAGRAVQLTVWRDGRAQTLSATLGDSRDRIASTFTLAGPRGEFKFDSDMFRFDMPNFFVSSRAPLLGISAEDISGQLGAYFGAPGGEGVLVREVNAGSPAEKAGMKAGDVITKFNGERVKSLDELREKLRAKREQKTVSVGVIRKGAEVSLNVEVEQPKPPERKRIARRTSL